ncbi:hypothetical protein [Ectobacillus sp. sgz5001026]|uniref:hypothetical protein n=1 Tax=Ectobacillus sp. sgz5001026 TaxID=3242473 RepID=UPI0036D3ED47
MEKQKLIVILLSVSMVLSALSAIGVGYLVVKQNQKPAFAQHTGARGGQMNPNGNSQNQSSATQQ